MNNFNYQETCKGLLKNLPSRTADVVSRRFGLENEEKETLASIGSDYGVTRERIRQIEENALSELKTQAQNHEEILNYFTEKIGQWGKLRREDKLYSELGGQEYKNHINFLLTLGGPFKRKSKTDKLHSLWTIDENSVSLAENTLDSLINHFEKKRNPFSFSEIVQVTKKKVSPGSDEIHETAISSFVEVSRKIKKGPTGEFGLKDWPEINPRGMRDRAFLVLRKAGEPLHFTKVTELINKHFPKTKENSKMKALPQTVHNELIKDDRFVLVGRGIYALKKWGYERGTVKDIIQKVLEESNRALSRDEIVEKVLDQRMVKRNTVLLNLQNNEGFKRNSDGDYILEA